MNYYNDNDPQAAAWLRELVIDGEIPDGEIDTRDIRDIPPGDLRGAGNAINPWVAAEFIKAFKEEAGDEAI